MEDDKLANFKTTLMENLTRKKVGKKRHGEHWGLLPSPGCHSGGILAGKGQTTGIRAHGR